MLSDEQIAEIIKRTEYRKDHGESGKWYAEHLDALLADRKEILAELEKLNAENHNLKYDNEEVAKLEAEVERQKAMSDCAGASLKEWQNIAGNLYSDLDIQKTHNKELNAENERLKAECVDFVKWHNEVCDGIQSDVDALDKELLAENAALKRAIIEYGIVQSFEFEYAPCSLCKIDDDAKQCENCDDGFSGFNFALDRFKGGSSHGE